jgi:hypothetical protein
LQDDFRDNILKHCPTLRSYGLNLAAHYLQEWLTGSLELADPLNISGWLGFVAVRNVFLAAPLAVKHGDMTLAQTEPTWLKRNLSATLLHLFEFRR